MQGYAFVVPKEGTIVRDPVSKNIVPAEGKKVKLDKYWRRRIADGDVSIKDDQPLEEKGE